MCSLSHTHTHTHESSLWKCISDRARKEERVCVGASDAREVNTHTHTHTLGLEDTYGRVRVTYGQTRGGDGEQETDEDAAVTLQTWVSELHTHTHRETDRQTDRQTHTPRAREQVTPRAATPVERVGCGH